MFLSIKFLVRDGPSRSSGPRGSGSIVLIVIGTTVRFRELTSSGPLAAPFPLCNCSGGSLTPWW